MRIDKTKTLTFIEFKCPSKFGYPELEQGCIKENCALWLPIQKMCSKKAEAIALLTLSNLLKLTKDENYLSAIYEEIKSIHRNMVQ